MESSGLCLQYFIGMGNFPQNCRWIKLAIGNFEKIEFSASSLKFATLTIGKKRTVQKETQSHIATACMQKSEHNIVTCNIYQNDLTG
jgi:hypothetical protein